MTTFLALALILQPGVARDGLVYSQDLQAKYWLTGAAHGAWYGREAGPFPNVEARRIFDSRRRIRAGSAMVQPGDLGQLWRVLAVTELELAGMLKSKDPLLVSNAITEAMLRKRQSLVPTLCGLAKEGAFQYEAIPALAVIGGTEAVGCLKGLVGSRNKLISVSAAYGLAARGLKDGVGQLRFAVRHTIVESLYDNRIVRGHAAKALVQLGAVTTRPQLDEVFRFTGAEGRYLCPLIARSRKPLHLAKLRDLLVDQAADHLVRKWAATALGNVRDHASKKNLRLALDDPSRQVREAAQAALRSLDEGHRRLMPAYFRFQM